MGRRDIVLMTALALVGAGCVSGTRLNMQPLAPSQKIDRIQDLSMAISRSPRDPELYRKRAVAYENNGDYRSAIADLDTAISLAPKEQKYQFYRGTAYAYAGDQRMARQDFAAAIAMDPNSAETFNAQAWLLATDPNPAMRNGKRAVEYATKACTMTGWKDPDMIETLAAAYAETGDFDAAIEQENKAIDLTSTTLLPTLNDRRTRLEFYKRHHPWRPTPPAQPIA